MNSRTRRDFKTYVGKYGPERILLWVGAGLSHAPPSGLPLGTDLTSFALQEYFGAYRAARLTRVWRHARNSCKELASAKRLGHLPRLETVLDAMIETSAACSEGIGLLQGFRVFACSPLNANHDLLARLVAQGCTAITTNFDTCIERACERIGAKDASHRVHHIHGSADNVFGLGATIAQVKQGLPRAFEEWLTGRLQAGACLLFLGYGAGDYFDVNLFFRSLTRTTTHRSSAVYVQHTGTSPPVDLAQLLGQFPKRQRVRANTTEVLEFLATAVGGGVHRLITPTSSFRWRTQYRALAGRGVRASTRAMGIARLCNTLGINPRKIDKEIARRCNRAKHTVELTHYHETMSLLHRIEGHDSSHRHHEQLRAESKEAVSLLSFYVTSGKHSGARNVAWSIDEIEASAMSPDIEWYLVGSMKVHAAELATQLLRNNGLDRDARLKAQRLRTVAEELSTRQFRDVSDLRKLANILRLNQILNALLGQRRKELRRASEIYAELSCLQGLGHCSRDSALSAAILKRTNRHRGDSYTLKRGIRLCKKISTAIRDIAELRFVRWLEPRL